MNINNITLMLLVTGCGPLQGNRHDRAEESISPAHPPLVDPIERPTEPPDASEDLNVDTILVAPAEIPLTVRAGTFDVQFRAVPPTAVFECALGSARTFSTCPAGDRYSFGGLAHGHSYALTVRARTPSGTVDASPLVIAFTVDRSRGPGAARLPASALDLPDAASTERSLQLGTSFAAAVPPGFLVTSYATNRTYNGAIRAMRLVGRPDLMTIIPDEPCRRPYEKLVPGTSGTHYCEATPTRASLSADYGFAMPLNHTEAIRGGATGVREKVFVSAFEDQSGTTPDPAWGQISIDDACGGSRTRGASEVVLVETFFHELGPRSRVDWCQMRDRDGRWWWLGMSLITFQPESGNVPLTLQVIYGVEAAQGIFSGPQFAGVMERQVRALLVPLVP